MKLTSFYVAAPVCTPSRAALMTGCYPKRIDMATGSNFAVLLAGDRKGLKWHLGDQPEFLPTRQGFDEYFGIPYSHDIHPFHPNQSRFTFPPLPLLDGEKVIEMDPDADSLTKRITQRAVRFIEKNKEHPFFLYIPHPIPVNYAARDKLFRQAINEIDWSVGQILGTLKQQGLDGNTLVIFTSDNGPAIGSAKPLKGRKGSTFEGGMREPTVVRWPGRVPAGTVSDELVTAMDLLPTVAKLAGAKFPIDRVIDGKDIWPVLSGKGRSPHKVFFYH